MKPILHQCIVVACFLLLLIPAICLADTPAMTEYQEAQVAADSALRSLSNEQLMQEYDDPGHLVSLAPYTVLSHGMPFLGADPTSPYALKYLLFGNVNKEIVRRGAPMVTARADFLTAVLSKPRRLAPTSPSSGIGCWYDTETIALLAQIRDPRSAQALLTILRGDGKKPAFDAYAAESALETLTYYCFYKGGYNLNVVHQGLAVPGLEASRVFPDFSRDNDFETVAVFYEKWLAGDGKDPLLWLPLARRRARVLLATDDPVFINDAALFLTHTNFGQGKMTHDDAPELTLKRLKEIAEQVEDAGTETVYGSITRPKYLYKGQPVPEDAGDLSRFIALCDPNLRQ